MTDKIKINPYMRGYELTRSLMRKTDQGLEILAVDFSDTLQGVDTSRVIDLMPSQAGRFLFRTKFNIKSIDPLAATEYGSRFVDIRTMCDLAIENLIKREDFDFALWFKHIPGFSMQRVIDYNIPFIVQVAGCNFHTGLPTDGCRFCFVDSVSNNGQIGPNKVWLSANDCLDSFLRARESVRQNYLDKTGQEVTLRVLRISGGESTLVLPWILELWQEIERRGLINDIVGQVDTNLSYLEPCYINHLEALKVYPVKFLAGLKGCDDLNLENNTQSILDVSTMMANFQKLVVLGLDVYPQMYNPNPLTLPTFLEFVDHFMVDNFSKRLHIGLLKPNYGPTRQRLILEAQELGKKPEQHQASIDFEWQSNFEQSVAVVENYLRDKYDLGYKESVRPDIDLNLANLGLF